jgi:hypothetical protein
MHSLGVTLARAIAAHGAIGPGTLGLPVVVGGTRRLGLWVLDGRGNHRPLVLVIEDIRGVLDVRLVSGLEVIILGRRRRGRRRGRGDRSDAFGHGLALAANTNSIFDL